MPRYRAEPYDGVESFSEGGEGNGPELESVETTRTDSGIDFFLASGYSAREVAENRRKAHGGTIYTNSVSRKIVRRDFQLATNAPVYYAVAESPIYTLLRKSGQVIRAYWPEMDR